MRFLGQWFARYGKTGNGRVAMRAGCLILAPFITLFVWMVQLIIWVVVAMPILTYALLMAIIGGGFRRGVAKPVAPTFTEPDTPI